MKTKGQRKREDRRAMRRREKDSDIPRDKMVGRAHRRGWGVGVPLAMFFGAALLAGVTKAPGETDEQYVQRMRYVIEHDEYSYEMERFSKPFSELGRS